MSRAPIAVTMSMFCLLVSCGNEVGNIFIRFDDATGLENDSPIFLNASTIGVIENIEVDQEYNVIATTSIEHFKLPVDTRFKIVKQHSTGAMVVEVEYGSSPIYLNVGDTAQGIQFEATQTETERINELLDRLKNMLFKGENDSLISEINLLRNRVDSLERVQAHLDSLENSD